MDTTRNSGISDITSPTKLKSVSRRKSDIGSESSTPTSPSSEGSTDSKAEAENGTIL